MKRTAPNRRAGAAFAMALFASAGASATCAAELYRWVDERGVVTYSNTPPKGRTGPTATIVEDRVSVYTPDRAVTEALERSRERRAQAEPERRVFTTPSVAPPAPANDACLSPGDPHCQVFLYDTSPVFYGRRRAPHLVQPQIPPGTIAGQAAGPGAYIAGQSGSAEPPARPRSSSGRAGFTVRERERDPPRH